jgi:hypothetical protein
MPIVWWKRKSFWSFFCIAFGLAFVQIKQYVFFVVSGILFILIGIFLSMIGKNKGGSDD